MIPSRAILNEKENEFVWVFNPKDSTISKHQVVVTGVPRGNISVVTGLDGSEKVVAVGVKQLKEGEKVNIVSNPSN